MTTQKRINLDNVMKEVSNVNHQLATHGLEDLVDVRVEVMENQYDIMTPHIVASYTESVMTGYDSDGYGIYDEKESTRIEELNHYFSGDLFAMGITQRAAWLKATHAERSKFLGQPGFNHPAQYTA
tara:strand:- start:290 stop:667 length:378 start_codon:yes stop_codon:yes gene_type:complete